MNTCRYLAYAAAIYTIASLFYFVRTRNIGTPFKDSLTEEQRRIKEESASQRKNIFIQGVALAIAILYFSKVLKC